MQNPTEQILAAATPGPWTMRRRASGGWDVRSGETLVAVVYRDRDADMLMHLVGCAPELDALHHRIDVLEREKAELDRQIGRLEDRVFDLESADAA